MTEFDEEGLQRVLRASADGFAVSRDAMDRILDEARELPAPVRQRRLHELVERTGRLRLSVMSAAACVVVLMMTVPLVNAESPAVKSATGFQKTDVPAAKPRSEQTVSGTGYQSGVAVPLSESQSLGLTPAPNSPAYAATGTAVTGLTADGKSAGKVSATAQSSLRVEELGTVQLSVGATQFQSTLTQLTDFATTDGGFVQSTQSHMGTKSTHSYSTGSIVLQVPERNFTMLVDQVRHAGDATSVMTSANDVTGQYVDLQARIKALQVSRTQYLKIMTRTGTINGILQVQNQLNQIQSQIEQLQAQLGLLNNETTYATLTVLLNQSGRPVFTAPHEPTGVSKAWHDSLHGFAAGVEWLIRIAGPLLFALLVLAALLIFGRLIWRATERRRNGIS